MQFKWDSILNYIGLSRHVELMKLKNSIWPRDLVMSRKVLVAEQFELYSSIVHLKVHGLKVFALELKRFIIIKIHRIGLPLQLQRKTHEKLWILKLMIMYEFGWRTLSRFERCVMWLYLLMFPCRNSIKEFHQNCKGKSLHTQLNGSEKEVCFMSHLQNQL